MKKPELLAPAGDMEKLQMAIAYGADAVYVGGKEFSLRANAKNFDLPELKQAIAYAHSKNVKVYVSVNIFANNRDFDGLHEYLSVLKEINADAVIVADLGVINVARQIPGLEIHISTQANVTNYQSAALYKELGAGRVILARELSFEEIKEVNEHKAIETEVFIHGAMCVSYSGRCLLSNYMAQGRDANRGDCAQPCRWKYHLVEELRPGEYMPVYEDERGTHILNSKDLCMIDHIPQLVASGVTSLKIEGRMKTAYYVAMVTKIYREALDDYFTDPAFYTSKKDYYMKELDRTGNRGFITGFFENKAIDGQNLSNTIYNNSQEFVGIVEAYDASTGFALVEQRNKFSQGDELEIISPKGSFKQIITDMYDIEGDPLQSAPHPQQMLRIKFTKSVDKFDIMRIMDKQT
ncbi:MAG: U32 family peptidase [Defluviitaleaceae bacterium]|nr:U32 family peptidase [Defluviitaleaceae bacterium]